MATLKEIRKRVSSVKNIQQITKAMKMVSAARLRRAQEAALAARPCERKISTQPWPASRPKEKSVHSPGRPALRNKNQYTPPGRADGRPGGVY